MMLSTERKMGSYTPRLASHHFQRLVEKKARRRLSFRAHARVEGGGAGGAILITPINCGRRPGLIFYTARGAEFEYKK